MGRPNQQRRPRDDNRRDGRRDGRGNNAPRDNNRGKDDDRNRSYRDRGNNRSDAPRMPFNIARFKDSFTLNLNPPADLRSLAPPSAAILPRSAVPSDVMQEEFVSASHAYMVPDQTVRADLKVFPSDFVVQEIDQDGVVASLSHPAAFDLPEADIAFNEAKDKRSAGAVTYDPAMDLEGTTAMTAILGEEYGAPFAAWVTGLREYTAKRAYVETRGVQLRRYTHCLRLNMEPDEPVTNATGEPLTIEEAEADLAECRAFASNRYEAHVFPAPVGQLPKETRREVHFTVRKYWEGAMVSDSVAKEGVEHQLLRVSSVAHGDLQSIDRRSKQQAKWYPGDKTQHLVVTMEKRNRDTSDALMTLSRLCGLSPRQIGIAGTKDKRAITTQNISFFRITATRIRDAMNAYYSRFAVNPRLPAAASTTPLTAAEHGPDIVLGNFRYAEEKRHLGMLSGNRFSVRLRNMDFKADADAADAAKTPAAPAPAAPAAAAPAEADEDEIPMEPADRMTSSRMRRETSRFSDRSLLPPARPVPIERAAALIKHVLRTMQVTSSTGFLNYFGIQRFGSSPISTHIVGLAVLHGNYKRALELVLLPRPNEAPPMRFAKSVLAGCVRRPVLYELEDPYVFPEATDHDLPAALHHLPNSAAIERSLLQGMMTSNPRDYKNLFGCILRTQRTLYVSAYQSYLFNAALSARFDLAVMAGHPDVTTEADLLKPLAGDIVLVNAHAAHNDAPAAPAAEEDEDAAADNEGDVSTESDMLSGDARVLTAAEAQSGAYSLSDVVFPLMAPGVLLPTNAAGDRVREMMSRDSLYLATPDAWGKQDSATYLSPGIREHVDSVVKTHKAAVAAANASDTEVPVWDPWVVLSAPGGVMAGQSKPFFRPMCRAPSQLTWAVTLRQVPAKGVAAQACVTSHTGMHPSRLAGLAAAAEADAMAEAGQGEEVCVVSGGSGETVELSRGGDSQVLGADAVVDAVCGLGQSLDEDAKARGVSVELHTQFSLSSSTYATTLLREILKAPASQSTRAQAYKLAKR